MAVLQLIRIARDGRETILEITPVPDSLAYGTWFYPPGYFEKMEEHYKKTGKPKKSYIDVVYITRRQVERE